MIMIAGLGKRRDELLGVSGLAIEPAPVFAGKIRAEILDGYPDFG